MIVFGIIFGILVLLLLSSLLIFYVVVHKSKRVIAQVASSHPLYADGKRFVDAQPQEWTIETQDALKLHAWYLPADQPTSKTVIVANGYHSIRDRFAAYGWMFHELGYNVLIPAYRASAEAEGKYLGFGWLDRDDYKRWMNKIIEKESTAEIAMFGISMGAASAMMVSGEQLPIQVKCFIADCGYDTLWNEIVFKAKHDFHLPAFPLVYLLSFWSKLLAGYHFKEVSSLNQLAKNTRPFLFIHGEDDQFVPTEMVHRNFAATSSPKEVLIVPKAGHAKAYETDQALYQRIVAQFLNKYL